MEIFFLLTVGENMFTWKNSLGSLEPVSLVTPHLSLKLFDPSIDEARLTSHMSIWAALDKRETPGHCCFLVLCHSKNSIKDMWSKDYIYEISFNLKENE